MGLRPHRATQDTGCSRISLKQEQSTPRGEVSRSRLPDRQGVIEDRDIGARTELMVRPSTYPPPHRKAGPTCGHGTEANRVGFSAEPGHPGPWVFQSGLRVWGSALT